MSSSWESNLTPQEVQAYKQCFQLAKKSQANVVTGFEAVQFFAKSGLSTEILSEIWEAADKKNLGYLTQDTFAIALKLISCAQNNIKAVEPLFSTVTPLPNFKGIQLTNTTTPPIAINPNDKKKYQTIYKSQNPTINGIPAEAAKALFAKSRLPNDQLAQIWQLADIRKSSYLDETEFVIAMHYIAKIMDKSITQLPSILPTDVYMSATSTALSPIMSPTLQSKAKRIDSIGNLAFSPSQKPATSWDITPQEKSQYDAYFAKLDTSHKGIIQGSQAVSFFKNSKLPEADLTKIWDLSDIRKTGTLNASEFAIAMHLIKKRSMGEPLPMVLPASLYPPTSTSPPSQVKSNISSPFQAPEEDLLGDFGNNEQLAEETSNVNLLQNQIASTKKSTVDVQTQKKQAEQNLTVLSEKKQDLKDQVTQLQRQAEDQKNALEQLQTLIEQEQPTWTSLQSEYDAAEVALKAVQQELEKAKQEHKNGQLENEKLRRNIHNVQMETLRVTKELDELHAANKKKQEAAAARRKAKEEKRIAAELKRKQQEEEETARKAEEERKRLEEEEAARKAEEERKRLEEEEAARKAEEERKRLEEEAAALKAEEERKRLEEEEAARKAEEEEEAARKAEEEEVTRKAEEERKRLEEVEATKKAEDERKRLEEEEAARKAEEEKDAKKVEEERIRLEEEAAAKKAEEEAAAKKAEEEATAAKIAEDERKRLEEEESARKAEEERKHLEEKAATIKLEEEQKRLEEAARKDEEERKSKEEEDARKVEESKSLEDETTTAADLEKKQEEETIDATLKEQEVKAQVEDKESDEKEIKKEKDDSIKENEIDDLNVKKLVVETTPLDAGTSSGSKISEEDAFSDSSESVEDFFDADDSTPISRTPISRTPMSRTPLNSVRSSENTTNEVDSSQNADESEFVMVDHPDQGKDDSVNTQSKTKDKDAENSQHEIVAPIFGEEQVKKELGVTENENEPVLKNKEGITSFDSVFGVNDQNLALESQQLHPQLNQGEDQEDEPVLISSLSGSEISDPFTVSTSSSTHKVAPPPPPPQSRKSRSSVMDNDTLANTKQKHSKKPPAPPPQAKAQPSTSSHNFDAIFDSSTGNNDTTNDDKENDDFESHFSDPKFNSTIQGEMLKQEEKGGFNSVTDVTPKDTTSTEKVDPSAFSPFEQVSTNAGMDDFDSAFGATLNKESETLNDGVTIRGFQDSFNEPPIESSPIQPSPIATTPITDDTSTSSNSNHHATNKGENQGVINNNRGVEEGLRKVVKEASSSSLQKNELEDDKKKKKKKNIMSWAKSIGGKKKKADKEVKKETPTTKLSQNQKPTKITKSIAPSVNSSSMASNPLTTSNPNLSYDMDTIQGNHIAQLVNMGFDTGAAIEALDRYDQDLELATNFLLDQAYH